jgi:hypothetical protein
LRTWFPEELPVMQFRSIAAITLWTIISGPIFAPPLSVPASFRDQSQAATLQRSPPARPAAVQPTPERPR